MNEFERIKEASGVKESTCSCSKCQAMCRRSPCIGTPNDIVQLINNGHIHELVATEWGAGRVLGLPVIDMIQLKYDMHGHCVMFKNGLCSIHLIKPTDGKLADHTPYQLTAFRKPPVMFVALTWLDSRNDAAIKFIVKAYLRYNKKSK